MKTIIKGVKKVTRLNGIIHEDDKMPVLDYKEYLLESDDIIQELDFELITESSVHANLSLFYYYSEISIFDKIDGLQDIKILKESVNDNIKTIIVNKVINTEEQKFNYDEIMAKYNDEFETYYTEFMKQFVNDKPMQIVIKNWLDEGMTREDVIKEIKKSKKKDKMMFASGACISNNVYVTGGVMPLAASC